VQYEVPVTSVSTAYTPLAIPGPVVNNPIKGDADSAVVARPYGRDVDAVDTFNAIKVIVNNTLVPIVYTRSQVLDLLFGVGVVRNMLSFAVFNPLDALFVQATWPVFEYTSAIAPRDNYVIVPGTGLAESQTDGLRISDFTLTVPPFGQAKLDIGAY
jgi:hypothetical protein